MDFDTTLSVGVSLSVLIGGLWAVLRYIMGNFTKPLADELKRFSETLTKTNTVLERLDIRQQESDKQVAIIQQTISALHRRLDEQKVLFDSEDNRIIELQTDFLNRMASVEKALETLSYRIDGVDDRLNLFVNFCSNHHKGDMDNHIRLAVSSPNFHVERGDKK